MRSLLILVALCVIATCASAQISFAPEIGGNLNFYKNKINGDNIGSRASGGIRAGVKADIRLCTHFYIQPGVFYVNTADIPPQTAGGYNTTLYMNTINIPVHFVYKLKTAGGVTPYFGVGPFLGVNISGRVTWSNELVMPQNPPPVNHETLKIGSGLDDNIKRYDGGISTIVGLQMPIGLYAQLLFQRGFANLAPGSNAENSITSFNAAISLGYSFHCCHTAKKVEEKK